MRTNRRRWFAMLALLVPVVALPAMSSPATAAAPGGPVVIMGIDGEDGGPGGHGPITVYEGIQANLLAAVKNGGTGVLVLGGNKAPDDSVTSFWDQISTDTGVPVTYANGATALSTQVFTSFAVVVVSSSESATPGGGLTDAESEALKLRSFDIATYVNGGGGLLVFTQNGQTTPYGFLGDLGTFVSADIQSGNDSDIDPTAAGTAAGVTDQLDVCCWHHQFTTFPSFLTVLATYNGSTEIAAIGGVSVTIPTGIVLTPPTQSAEVGGTCVVTATITENQVLVAGRDVRFSITGPNAPKTATVPSNAQGVATFSYTGSVVGTDTVAAEFTDSQDRVRVADVVTCAFTAAVIVPANPIAANPALTG